MLVHRVYTETHAGLTKTCLSAYIASMPVVAVCSLSSVCSLHAEEQSLVVSESPSSAYALISSESEDCCSVSDGERSVIPERITVAWISTKAVRGISNSADLISHTAHLHRPGQYSLPEIGRAHV